MKLKTIISVLFLLVVTVLYFFGSCQWDMLTYMLCIAAAVLFMGISLKQQKKYQQLQKREDYLHSN